MRGQMLWFNEDKDHGFIRTDDGERLQVDGTGFAQGERPEGRCADKVVSFDTHYPPPSAARRARIGGTGRGGRR